MLNKYMKKNYSRTILLVLVIIVATLSSNAQSSFKLPAYQKFKLKNGLTVYLMEQHEVPTISVSAILPAGAVYDGDKSGLATLTAGGLTYGTKNLSKAEIEAQIDFLGASLNTYATKESANVDVKFAKKDQDEILNILKEVLVYPVFDGQEFAKEKARYLQQLERATESPKNVIENFWDHFIYGNHPYGNPTGGKIASVYKIEAADLKSFYKDNYHPNTAAIAIVGDFDAKEMQNKITKIFADWKKGESKNVAIVAASPIPAIPRVLLVNKDDARETTMFIGGKGVQRGSPDEVAIKVINTALGGRFTSWLNDELRVNSGLTYGARSVFNSFKNSGTFYVSTFTATKTTKPTIDKSVEVLQRLKKNGIDEKTLTSAKNYVKGQFPPEYETSEQLAGLLSQMFFYGFDEGYVNNFEANVDGLNTAKVKGIIEKYFPSEELQFLFIGKSADIKNTVSGYGQLIEKDIKNGDF